MSISTANSFLPSVLSVASYDASQSVLSSSVSTASHRRERQLNYKIGVVSSVHHIECRLLYRILMKIEIPFRGLKMKSNRHRFIKLLYENACSDSPDYESIIGFIKQHLGLYISLHDARQLLLYSALFGKSEICGIPPVEDTLRVIKTCPLSVPPFVNFKKWSKDVKRLESRPVSDVTKLPGYFSHVGSGGTECVSILSTRDDLREFDKDIMYIATSSEAENADSNSDSETDSDDEGQKKNRKRIPPLLAQNFLGSDVCNDLKEVTLIGSGSDDENAEGGVVESEHEEVTPRKGQRNEEARKRKKGALNLYERSDNHQLNKMILVLSRGESGPVADNDANKGEIAHRFSKIFIDEKKAVGSRFVGMNELISDDDSAGSDCEERRERNERRRLEKEKRRKEKLEKQKKNIVKLTNFTSLRPSLAKLDMIRRLRRRRQYETSAPDSGGSSEWVFGDSTANQVRKDYNLMSL